MDTGFVHCSCCDIKTTIIAHSWNTPPTKKRIKEKGEDKARQKVLEEEEEEEEAESSDQ